MRKAGEKTFPWKASTGKQSADIAASFVMMIPSFNGQDYWKQSSKGLADEKDFISVDEFMRNPAYLDVFGVRGLRQIPTREKSAHSNWGTQDGIFD
jgi:hypothetical protein